MKKFLLKRFLIMLWIFILFLLGYLFFNSKKQPNVDKNSYSNPIGNLYNTTAVPSDRDFSVSS